MSQPSEFKALDKSLRKQQVIDAATRVFHQKGYHSATLEDVAAELGLSKAALYHYVSSKEDLLSHIYLQALEAFFASAYEIGRLDLAPPAKLRRFIRHHIQQVIIDNLAMFAVFFAEENQLPEADRRQIRREKAKYTQVVEGILAQGMAQGHFRPSDPRLTAFALIGMCNWVYKWYRPGAKGFDPQVISEHFITLLEQGLLARPEGQAAAGRPRELVQELRRQAQALAAQIAELEKLC
ncbi:MAG: TetR/AcrR family transcriptional regulator [Desulfarculus sp.]|jgi:AcrR family transcriptional regulator|nr:MAG: TetR/AcrR family transcriptional regulator [Desulfarculus sp.]